jgi:hypothetical protein
MSPARGVSFDFDFDFEEHDCYFVMVLREAVAGRRGF